MGLASCNHHWLQALRENNIQVVLVHTHLLNEEPHLLFIHFWANGAAATLAQGLRASLDKANHAES